MILLRPTKICKINFLSNLTKYLVSKFRSKFPHSGLTVDISGQDIMEFLEEGRSVQLLLEGFRFRRKRLVNKDDIITEYFQCLR